MSDSTVTMFVAQCCLLFVLFTLTGIVQGQTCDCTVSGGCTLPRLCYPDSQPCTRENVALGRPSNQSSPNSSPCHAVDGIVPLTGGEDCSATETKTGDCSPKWTVDLGHNYTIRDITIYTRLLWKTRMAELQVLVGDQLCYTFPYRFDYDWNSLSFPVNITCDPPRTGRFVTLQKTLTVCPVDSYTYNLISVCEVQVWGCTPGYYGADCNSCGHCAGTSVCDVVSGRCSNGCQAGWQGALCDQGEANQECDDGFYGNCYQQCGHCQDNRPCNKANGECPGECVAGWKPPLCQTACDNGYYGNCYQRCGQCQYSSPCNKTNGHCLNGCLARWKPPLCQECDDGFYGNCYQQCGHCQDNRPCNKGNGECPGECVAGWKPPLCQTACDDGYYGTCSQKCGQCKDNNPCNKINGECLNGCLAGWKLPLCQSVCDDGYYGDCTQLCGRCRDGSPCNKTNGECPNGCRDGGKPPLCQSECENGYYGDCIQPCGQCKDNRPCNKTNGKCPGGCQAGWKAPLCQSECDGGYYGDCTQPCGQCKDDSSCNRTTGECPSGCQVGWKAPLCQSECDNGRFGQDCTGHCGHCANDTKCDSTSGACPAGCQTGWNGTLCKERVSAPMGSPEAASAGKQDNVPVIAGAAGGAAVLIIVVVVIVIFVVRRRRRSPDPKLSEPSDEVSTGVDTAPDSETDFSSGLLSFQPVPTPKPAPEIRKLGTKPAVKTKPQVAVKPTVIRTQKKSEDVSGHIYMNQPQPQNTSSTTANGAFSRESAADTASVSNTQATHTPVPARRNLHSDDTPESDDRMSLATTDTEFGESGLVYQNEDEVYAVFKASKPQLDSVQRFLVDRLASGELRQEFKDIPTGQEASQDAANLPENFKKNRFASIQPYDYNRVELTDGYKKDESTDFVNASYISGYKSEKAYIAAQGPRDYTTVDFWRLVWQEKITHIVMLTNVVETGKSKCHEYWPARKKTKTHGPLKVTGLSEEVRASYVIRTFRIKMANTQGEREVVQYHYVSWPDHDVPTTTSLIVFWRFVMARTASNNPKAPLLVHCSAGVGRTGTFIGLDNGFKMAVQEGKVDVRELVERMRNERCWMVQAPEQYYFLHKALLEAYTARDTFRSVGEFVAAFPEPVSVSTGHPRIEAEFKMLTQMRSLAPKHTHDFAENDENIAKNRYPEILPSDDNIVHLMEFVPGRNQYINAVYMSTFWQEQGSILTQLPLPDTLVDFWRMVYGSRAQTVVSLAGKGESEEVKPYCWYWPRDVKGPVKTGPYTIHFKTQSKIGDRITCYSLKIDKQSGSSSHNVRLLRYEDWTGDVPANTSDLLYLLDALDNTGGKEGKAPTIIIQCSDGVSKSGLFSAICDVIQRMRCDLEVDVYMTVRHVQSVTPQAVSKEIQYRYLYDLIQRQASEMNVYANT